MLQFDNNHANHELINSHLGLNIVIRTILCLSCDEEVRDHDDRGSGRKTMVGHEEKILLPEKGFEVQVPRNSDMF